MPSVATRVSSQEYLERERNAQTKNEYRNGEIVAMAGASVRHGRIIRNLMFHMHAALRNGPCEVFSTDLRLAVRAANLFTYPDVMIVCGEPEIAGDSPDTISNPVVLIEVLSKATETYDRGEKFAAYRTIPSLIEYVTVAQDKVHVEQYTREADEQWLRSESKELCDCLRLRSVGIEVRLADIYERINLARD